ncbi:MAG: DUF423 domain-containing protein [Rhodospirillaceae bacterium]
MKLSRFALSMFVFGAASVIVAIIAAAFAAHGIERTVQDGTRATTLFEGASSFQMSNALGLMLIALAAEFAEKGIPTKIMRISALLLSVSVLLFPGALYWSSFGGSAALAPVGGFAAMSGWLLFALAALYSLVRKRTYL